MKKYQSVIIKIVGIFLLACSLYLLLLSPVKFQVDNTHAMAKTVISRVISESNNLEIKEGAKMVKDSGLEDDLISALPRKFKKNFSYADIYVLSRKYNQTGKITMSDLDLDSRNRVEDLVNRVLIKAINQKLREDSEQMYHIISIYQYSIFLVILLYILAAVLMLFNRYWASLPLLLGSLSSFGVLEVFCREANYALQTRVYRGFLLQIDPRIWLGLAIAVVVALAWPIILKKFYRGVKNNA